MPLMPLPSLSFSSSPWSRLFGAASGFAARVASAVLLLAAMGAVACVAWRSVRAADELHALEQRQDILNSQTSRASRQSAAVAAQRAPISDTDRARINQIVRRL